MTEFAYRLKIRRWLPSTGWLPIWAQIGLVIVALVVGLMLARLPLLWAVIGLLVIVLTAATFVDPMVGVGVMLVLGPTKPATEYFIPQLPLDLGQIPLLITLFAWLLHAIRRKRITVPMTRLNLPLLIFIGAASLSTINALSVGFALKELIKWVQLVIVMWLVIDLDGRRRWPTVIAIVLGAALLQALVGIWQFGIRGDGPEHFLILDDRFYRAYGSFEQPNPYAGFLGLTLPLALGLSLTALEGWVGSLVDAWKQSPVRRGYRILARMWNIDLVRLIALGVLSGLLLAGLVMSWSRGSWFGFGAASLVILLVWPRKWWLGLGLVGGGGLLMLVALQFHLLPAALVDRLTGFTAFLQTFDVRGVDINSANFAVLERLAHWQVAQEMARFHPLLGVGFGNYEPVYPGFAFLNWPLALGHAHNIYLNMLAEVGLIGLTAYVALWISVFWQTWRLIRRTQDRWQRGVAMGLIGTWTHLTVHQLLDKLYVANLHLHIGALLGVLAVLILLNREYPVDE